MVWNFVFNCSDPFLLYTYCHVTSQQPFSRHYDREKGVCCGFLNLIWNWILKYFTCSSSTCNSCSNQNNGQEGSLQELIQKSETYRSKIMGVTWNLASELLLFNSCPELFKRWFPSKVLVSDFGLWLLLEKSTKMKEKNAASWQNLHLGVHLADRARPKSPFSPEKGVKNVEVKKSRTKFLKGNFLSCCKELVEKI